MRTSKLIAAMRERAAELENRAQGHHTFLESVALGIASNMVGREPEDFDEMQQRFLDDLDMLAAGMFKVTNDPRWSRLVSDRAKLADRIVEAAGVNAPLLATEDVMPDPVLRALVVKKLAVE